MRKTVYYLGIGLFVLSLTAAGNSSAQTLSREMSGHLTTMGLNTFKASDLIGMQLYTREMEVLGQISNLVIDPATKSISRVVISDIPGMGGESMAIPFSALVKIGNNTFAYNSPENVYYFFGEKPAGYGENPYWSVGFYWAADIDYVIPYVQPMPAGAEKTSQLIGARVETPEGEDVAWINDLVVDSENGHVVFFVLSDVGRAENRMVAVPFGALSETHAKVFVLNTSKDKLLAASGFKWEDAPNRTYAENIYRYYGLQPYWETE